MIVALLSTATHAGTTPSAGSKDQNGVRIPACFATDTIYFALLNISQDNIEISYGTLPLVTVKFMPLDDPGDMSDFARDWREKTPLQWQTTLGHRVWAGHAQISDTVIRIVSEVASVDPVQIQRLLPERFDIELTGGFRLRVMTEAGHNAAIDFSEKWYNWKSRWSPLSKVRILEIQVSPEDAQILYYAFEQGTPVVLSSTSH